MRVCLEQQVGDYDIECREEDNTFYVWINQELNSPEVWSGEEKFYPREHWNVECFEFATRDEATRFFNSMVEELK